MGGPDIGDHATEAAMDAGPASSRTGASLVQHLRPYAAYPCVRDNVPIIESARLEFAFPDVLNTYHHQYTRDVVGRSPDGTVIYCALGGMLKEKGLVAIDDITPESTRFLVKYTSWPAEEP